MTEVLRFINEDLASILWTSHDSNETSFTLSGVEYNISGRGKGGGGGVIILDITLRSLRTGFWVEIYPVEKYMKFLTRNYYQKIIAIGFSDQMNVLPFPHGVFSDHPLFPEDKMIPIFTFSGG